MSIEEWFIQIEGKQEGPFSFEELKRDRRITPDTLVWKAGFSNWLPIRKVAELRDLFKDEENENSSDEENEDKARTLSKKSLDNDVLTLQYDPSHWIVWLIIILIILLYVLFRWSFTHQ